MPVYIPLKEGTKEAAVMGWASPEYKGVEHHAGDWHALRTDGLVVVDYDSHAAWELYGHTFPETLTIATPRGFHGIYRWTPGSPEGPAVGVLPSVDIRAGRRSYIVAPDAPDRSVFMRMKAQPFDPSRLPKRQERSVYTGAEWDRIPEGRRNHTLAAIAGLVRREGGSVEALGRTLGALNAVLLSEPLEREELVQIAQSVSRYDPKPTTLIDWSDE